MKEKFYGFRRTELSTGNYMDSSNTKFSTDAHIKSFFFFIRTGGTKVNAS